MNTLRQAQGERLRLNKKLKYYKSQVNQFLTDTLPIVSVSFLHYAAVKFSPKATPPYKWYNYSVINPRLKPCLLLKIRRVFLMLLG